MFSAVAVGLSALIAKSTSGIPLAPVSAPVSFTLLTAIITQVFVALSLIFAKGVTTASKQESLAKLLLIWPVGSNTRWLIFMLPNCILGALTLLLICPALLIAMHKLGLAWLLIAIGVLCGYLSAFGLAKSPLSRVPNLIFAWIPAVLWAEYDCILSMLDIIAPSQSRNFSAIQVGAILAILILLGLMERSSMRGAVTAIKSHGSVRLRLPLQLWFGSKLLRRPNLRISFLICLLLSIGLSVAVAKYRIHDLGILGLAMAMLAASVSTDIRSLSRRNNPAEITALQGTRRFAKVNILAALCVGLLVSLPIFIAARSVLNTADATLVLHVILQLTLGIYAGLLAATVLVPQGRDISSQFVTSIFVLVILYAFPQIQVIGRLLPWQRNIVDLFLIIAMIVSIYGIEIKRNNYEWRKIYAS